MGSSGSDKGICVGNPMCWLLLLLTASLIVNVVFAVFGYLAVRNLQNNVRDLQNDMADVQQHQTIASGMKEEMSEMLSNNAADREKKSASSSSSSFHLTADVGSVFVSAIKRMCKRGTVCIPGAKGEAGQPGRDGLPGTTGRDGPVGLRGLPGKPGAKGMGLPGKQGPIGGKGEKGERGSQGERGYTGDKGERGMRGEKGNNGIRGEKGELRESGESGESGELGKSETPSQCNATNHQVLSHIWRKVSSTKDEFGYHRDGDGFHGFRPGWHVFDASIGGGMPETCPPTHRCGTYGPGWLNGSHPTAVGQTSKETVCFHWNDNCCFRQVTVDITNCGQFYAYNLPNEPYGGGLAYCSNA